jgi:tRNA A37 threonylcarbamoyladenosine biosynthesis protein TsaE
LGERISLEWEELDEDALRGLAAEAAGYLVPGDVVVLKGEVGTGKTTFVHRTPDTRRLRLSGPLAARLSSKPC